MLGSWKGRCSTSKRIEWITHTQIFDRLRGKLQRRSKSFHISNQPSHWQGYVNKLWCWNFPESNRTVEYRKEERYWRLNEKRFDRRGKDIRDVLRFGERLASSCDVERRLVLSSPQNFENPGKGSSNGCFNLFFFPSLMCQKYVNGKLSFHLW